MNRAEHDIERAPPEAVAPASPPPRTGEGAVVWVVWLVYGVFYFCRTNLSVAVPALKSPVAEGGLGLSANQVGTIQSVAKLVYGVGQLVNGQFAELASPRMLLAIGLFGSAALNVAFGTTSAFFALVVLWGLNSYCQSLGWTPCVRVIGNWVPVQRRGRAIGIVGTGYQITLGLTWLVAGWAAAHFGWRGALFVPASVLAAGGVFMLVFLKDAPGDGPAMSSAHSHESAAKHLAPSSAFLATMLLTLSNPSLWILGIALGLLNACRYGFVDWGIAHLVEVQNVRVDKAAFTYGVFGVGAVAGSYLTGVVTDRFFGGRRAPVLCGLLLSLAGLTMVYEQVSRVSLAATTVLLVLIGFCVIGPQVLLVGTAPADLARRGTAAAAAGFVNFMGYMGAAMGDKVTGYYIEPVNGGWQTAITIWAAWALGAAAAAALLWNARPRSE